MGKRENRKESVLYAELNTPFGSRRITLGSTRNPL